MPRTYVTNSQGVYVPAKDIYVADSQGVWKKTKEAYIADSSGVWRKIHPPVLTLSLVVSAWTIGYNIKTAAIAAGWNGSDALTVTVTVTSGYGIGAASTGAYALDTGTNYPTGSSIVLINNGYISGKGGDGGGGGRSYAGDAGGPAILAQYPMTIANAGVIQGGGGGGSSRPDLGWGGGGGGAGYPGGVGGIGGGYDDGMGPNGRPGTLTAGGIGGFYYGGAGGDPGSAGAVSSTIGPYPAGAAGYAVVGNSRVSWSQYGTVLGPLAA